MKLLKDQDFKFGILFSVIFALIPSIFEISNKNYLFGFSLTLLIISFIRPYYLKPFRVIWINIGIILGKYISPIVMFIIYFFIFLPTRIFFIFEKKKKSTTFWNNCNNKNINFDDQF